MVTASLAMLAPAVAADDSRADSEPKPDWEIGNIWIYRRDFDDLEEYMMFGVIYQQSPRIVADVLCNPSEITAQYKSTLTGDTSGQYEITTANNVWENGTWKSVISESEDPGWPVGTQVDSGTYTRTATLTGKERYLISNLNSVSSTLDLHDYTDADDTDGNQGDLSWTLTIDEDRIYSTQSPNAEWKPTWSDAPMEVGDSWKQDNEEGLQRTQTFEFGGSVQGSGSASITYTWNYDYTWAVASKSQKQIQGDPGTCTFADAFRLTRNGQYSWEVDDGTQTNSGTTPVGESETWYAGDGDLYDAGWGIEYNQSSYLAWSTYEAFINSPPLIEKDVTETQVATEDEVWEFVEGVDYDVLDNDPGEAGQLGFTIDAVLGSNSNVLTDLNIDPDTGDIDYTPTQTDVADGYTITITATDGYKDPLSVDVVFTLNIENSNDAPGKNTGVMADVEVDEGDTETPSWKLSDVFFDPDMDPNPLMSNNPYDPNEALSYSYTFSVPSDDGSIIVKCGNGEPLSTSNQCDAISFEAADGSFPTDRPVPMTFTATDKGGMKANEQMTVRVKHTNHEPTVKEDAEDEFEMDEDTVETIDLKDYFFDYDVDTANYRNTGDKLTFDKDGEENIKITITGSRAKLEPDANWNGEEEITFEAADNSGQSVTHDLNIIVNPVNDLPEVTSVDPDTAPVLDETEDGEEDGDLTQQDFKVVATDVDKDTLSFNWSVTEDESGDVYDISTHTDTYTFETVFKGDFTDGEFDGGDGSKSYTITVYVTDGKAEVKAKEWYVTVKNVNRKPTVDGVDISEVKKDGSTVAVSEKSAANYSLKFGKVYRFDATNWAGDEDEEDILDLHYDWSSDKDGPLGSDISIDIGAGKGSALASAKLKSGKHVITLRVSDDEGASAEYAFTVKIPADTEGNPGFEAVMLVGAVVAAVAVLSYRRRK